MLWHLSDTQTAKPVIWSMAMQHETQQQNRMREKNRREKMFHGLSILTELMSFAVGCPGTLCNVRISSTFCNLNMAPNREGVLRTAWERESCSMSLAVHAARSACFICDALNGKPKHRTTWLLLFCQSLEKERHLFRSLSVLGFFCLWNMHSCRIWSPPSPNKKDCVAVKVQHALWNCTLKIKHYRTSVT